MGAERERAARRAWDDGAEDAGIGADATSERRLDQWLYAMERLRLAEFVRYADDRKRMFVSQFLGGLARGLGMAVGFTILGAVLVLVLQDLASRNLPVIGDVIARIVSVVQARLE